MPQYFESENIQISGLVVAENSNEYSHWNASKSLSEWLYENKVPGIEGIDTRCLTKKLRERGTMLSKIVLENEYINFFDPSKENMVRGVSTKEPIFYQAGPETGSRHRLWL